jgi:hypothetical protein
MIRVLPLAALACATPTSVVPTFPSDPGDPTDDPTAQPGVARPFNGRCKTEAPGVPIADASGTFEVTGPADAPLAFGVGTWVAGTGSLHVVACVPSAADEILDRLVLDIELVLFDIDDQPVNLAVADDATGVNVLWGTVTDWDGVTSWADGGTFMYFERGSSSFTELDKQGRLVGDIDVTSTDPAGHPMAVALDLTW